jgi:hypothetical protein
VGKRLRELQIRLAPMQYLNGEDPTHQLLEKAPGFWMLLAPSHDGCHSCKFI